MFRLEKFSLSRREIEQTAKLKLSRGVFRDAYIKDFNKITIEAC